MGIYGFPLVVNLIKVNEGEKETGINDLSGPGNGHIKQVCLNRKSHSKSFSVEICTFFFFGARLVIGFTFHHYDIGVIKPMKR